MSRQRNARTPTLAIESIGAQIVFTPQRRRFITACSAYAMTGKGEFAAKRGV